jgi:hypothetical protein
LSESIGLANKTLTAWAEPARKEIDSTRPPLRKTAYLPAFAVWEWFVAVLRSV